MPLSSRTQKRVDRIHQEVPIAKVLLSYGYLVHGDNAREEQFPCDLHGDGLDQKPSGRIYPESNSWFCFACGKARDAIQTVREKEGMSFPDALYALEKRFNLEPLPWEEDARPLEDKIFKDQPSYTYGEEALRTEKLLRSVTLERELPMRRILAFWEAFDMVSYWHEKNGQEDKSLADMTRIRQTVIKALLE